LDELLQAAPTPSGIYTQHLQGHLTMLRNEPALASALQQVVSADESVELEAIAQSALPEAIVAYKLERMGLIQLDDHQASPSCQLYRLYFRQQLDRLSSLKRGK
jgi:hypothetical protein